MNREFEGKETMVEEGDSSEFNEPISTAYDLEQEKKRVAQEFNALGNIGTTQIFINSLGLLGIASQQKQDDQAGVSTSQTYHLHTRKGCASFVEQYKNSEYLAMAIVLSVFELVRLDDLHDLKELLMAELPNAVPMGEDTLPPVQDPYISVDTLLSTIGGRWFTSLEGKHYVGLGETAQTILQNLWEQFPALWDPICRWLVKLSGIYKSCTAFDINQIVCAFAQVVSLDFEIARKRLFPKLYSSEENVGLLGNLVYKLYEQASLRRELEELLQAWLDAREGWLWRSASLACSFLMPRLDEKQFGPIWEQAVRCRLTHLSRSDSSFLAILLIQSEYFRTLLARLLGQMVQEADGCKERLTTAQTYLYLLRSGYYIVDSQRLELPLVACDSKEQQQSLSPVLAEVLGEVGLRRQLNAILWVYLEELDHYQYPDCLFDHLCAYFYNMSTAAPGYSQDILECLSNCRGMLGARIRERLFPIHSLSPTITVPEMTAKPCGREV